MDTGSERSKVAPERQREREQGRGEENRRVRCEIKNEGEKAWKSKSKYKQHLVGTRNRAENINEGNELLDEYV